MLGLLAQATQQATTAAVSASQAVTAADYGVLPVVMFYTFGAIVLGGAFAVALARNIVRAATGLLFALAGMAGLYLQLHAEFLAAVQLVVYVGGTLILIIFGVMLTTKSPGTHWAPKIWEVVWGLLIGLIIVCPLLALVTQVQWPQNATQTQWSVEHLGEALIDPSRFLAPFELISVVLLAVMIGAAYLAKSRKEKHQ